MRLALSYYRVMRMWDTDIHVLNACVCLRIAHKEKITSWLQAICFILHVSIVVGHGRGHTNKPLKAAHMHVYLCVQIFPPYTIFDGFSLLLFSFFLKLQHLTFFFFFGSNVFSRIFSHQNQKSFFHRFMTMRLTKRRLWTSREREKP